MKLTILTITCAFILSSCFIFQRKEKYGCPTDGRSVGAEKIAAGDAKALKASSKARYKGGRRSY